jgi:hypothetical protein
MKLQTLAAVAALSFAFTGTAFADGKVVATLQAPVAAKTKVLAGGAVFTCEGSTCTALSVSDRTVTTAGCKDLVKAVGAVASLGGAKSLSTENLAKCNAGAIVGQSVATN